MTHAIVTLVGWKPEAELPAQLAQPAAIPLEEGGPTGLAQTAISYTYDPLGRLTGATYNLKKLI